MKTLRSIALGVTTVMALTLCGCGCTEPSERRAAAGQSGVDESRGKSPNTGSPEDMRSMSESGQDHAPGVPNPADEHCVEAGHRLEYIYENRIPVDGLCINEVTGAKCISWAYFRGECTLDTIPLSGERNP